MNDIKYLCEQLLDDAPPLMRDATTMFSTARRSNARRSAIRTVGGFVAIAAVTAATALGVPAFTANNAAVPVASPLAAGTSNAAAPNATSEVPYAQASGTHDRKMFQAIQRALPPGYTATAQYPFSDNSTPYPTDPAAPLTSGMVAMVVASVAVLVTKDNRVGWVSAFIQNNGRPVPTGDPCGPDVAAQENDPPGTTCEVIDVNGTKIRVTRAHWTNTAPEIDVITAKRYLRNGSITITHSRSVPDFQSEQDELPPDAVNQPQQQTPTSALGDWVLTDDELAALIADPAMLP